MAVDRPGRKRLRIQPRDALVMIGGYARRRILEQIRSVAFIIIYLVLFQTLILGSSPGNAIVVAGGIGLVVLGLALFLEGVLLGLMPLGERVGVMLPARCTITIIVLFGILLGIGATLAEPAIAVLRSAGAAVTAWEAPLLYVLLQRYTEYLVGTIALGVGVAVAIGVARFYYGFSIKPVIFTVFPVLLGATIFAYYDPSLSKIVGLAWDSGAVTTGPVTVPLVLAVGIGVSRATGKGTGSSNAFGLIMLASALPVLAVLILGLAVNRNVPPPTTESAFFSPENRSAALQVFATEDELLRHAFSHGSDAGRQAFLHNEVERANAYEAHREAAHGPSPAPRAGGPDSILRVLREEAGLGVRAVVPLTALLLLVLLVLLRDRPRYYDEVILGITLALVGMILLTTGIRVGLAPLGDGVGRELPRAFRTMDEDHERVVIESFDQTLLQESIDSDGNRRRFFYLHKPSGPVPVEYDPTRYDATRQRYEHIVRRSPLFGPDLTLLGLGLVLLFAFGMGYGSSLAEPALNALGRTVEELTVGTVRGSSLVRAVSIGVGAGLVAGIARILWDFSIVWLLIPTYILLLLLTIRSDEEFTGIAWDSGGVTTGPVTVPLVLAMGLAIGGEMNVIDGFGVLAMASAFPNLAVLLYGFVVQTRQRRAMQESNEGRSDE
jgi:hypothetical protein